jgi:hypothetical protein
MEERMLAQARAGGAPCLTRAEAARALGVDLEPLEHALAGRAHGARNQHTRTGLHKDQAPAMLSVLTDGKRVSVSTPPPDPARPDCWPRRKSLGRGRARPGDRHPQPTVTSASARPGSAGWPSARSCRLRSHHQNPYSDTVTSGRTLRARWAALADRHKLALSMRSANGVPEVIHLDPCRPASISCVRGGPGRPEVRLLVEDPATAKGGGRGEVLAGLGG